MSTAATVATANVGLNDVIMWDINRDCFAFGYVVQTTEKAVKIDYHLQPITLAKSISIYDRSTWIPKSILQQKEGGTFEVPIWFAKKIEPQRIKQYYTGRGGEKIYC